MKIILAQGNPEARYEGTRHNVGFAIIDAWAQLHSATWTHKPKFFSQVAEVTIDDTLVLLVKPSTYYNETGRAARTLVDFYKADPATDLLIIHDDLALPLGTIRVRQKGSDAGNNGIKSHNIHIGEAYQRLRIGIMSDRHFNDMDFVLGRFSPEEQAILEPVVKQANQLIDDFIAGRLDITSHRLETT